MYMKKFISVILAICTIISIFTCTAYALSWDGSSANSNTSAGSVSDPGYAIRTSSDNCIGYRFSCVKDDGSMKVTKVIDVYRDTGYGKLGYSNGYKFTTKYNKKQLIAKQTSGFSTSKNSTNCYKETAMDFYTDLPKPSGMGTWQKYEGNLNPVLAKLGVGSISKLTYGEKVIVEPIYDICIKKVYHSVTVTELALYGKYLLGASSDGGSSATSNTWGFISKFTNKVYPNDLYTPNGQGLWTAASALSSRATFYNIINKGYGVGIAYTENSKKLYSIKFNGNGATSGSMSNLSMVYGTAKKLTANAFKKTGNAFYRWNTKSDGSGTAYKNQQSVKNLTSTHNGVVNLYAIWSPYKLNVAYNANGGAISSDTYTLKSKVVQKDGATFYQVWSYNSKKTNGLANITTFGISQTGYKFNQWNTKADGSGTTFGQNDVDLKPTDLNSGIKTGNQTMTLYAKWQPINYTIQFNGNGATSGSTASLSMIYDVAKNLTTNGFTKTGNDFLGWNTKADGTGTGYSNAQSVKNLTATDGAVITLYAQWANNSYNVTFNGNGATGGSTSSMVLDFDETKNLSANGYTRQGYRYDSWNTKADGSGTKYINQQAVKNLTTVKGGTVTLYARWNPNTYTVQFNGNGATSGTTASMSMTYDVAKNLTPNGFNKTGYIFMGWNEEKDGSGIFYDDKESVKNLTDIHNDTITLYAIWKPITYTIVFDGNGAINGETESMYMTYDQEDNLSPNEFTRSSYNFLGWNTKADGSGKNYTDEELVKNLTTVNNDTVTLYARWEYCPVLAVNKCNVYDGTKGTTAKLYGVSQGNTFDDYTYKTDYPTIGNTVWFNIHFPKEAENIKVRQYVKNGGAWVTRDVTLSSSSESQWFPVQFTGKYKTIDANTAYYEVQAKTDWLDDEGNIKKEGEIKTFYIPIKPVVYRTQVTATGYEGTTVAYGNKNGTSGKLYSGQKVNFSYRYTADNEWSACEILRASAYTYENGAWTNTYKENEGFDANQNTINISKDTGVTLDSVLNNYTVPLTLQNKLRFKLQSYWIRDEEHTGETTWYDIPVVKADVAITSILLYDASTNERVDPASLDVGQKVIVRYVYKNNTDTNVYVEGFKNDKNQIKGVYVIPANDSITVTGYTFTVPNTRTLTIWGGVYLQGMGINNTEYESNGANNEKTLNCKVNHPLNLIAITPNAAYREKTEVVTSFWLNNKSSVGYNGSEKVSARFYVYNGNELIRTITKSNVVVPGNENNLLYFKWSVPTGVSGNKVRIVGEVVDGGKTYNRISNLYNTTKYLVSQTPDTQFEKKTPNNFTLKSASSPNNISAEWWEWVYSSGTFTKKTYGVGISESSVIIAPETGQTAEKVGSVWNMKSGYGISLSLQNNVFSASKYATPSASSYTLPQYAVATFPEFEYSLVDGKCRTLLLSSNCWAFRDNEDYGKVHFTPLWYPNGTYIVSVTQSDMWTPSGMISRTSNSNKIKITDSAYDDWHIGR